MNRHLLAAEAYDSESDDPFRQDPRVRSALANMGTAGMVSAHLEVEDGREVCVVGTDQPNPWIGSRSNCLDVIHQQPTGIERWEFDEPGPPNPQAAASHLYRMLVPLPDGGPPPLPESPPRRSRWPRLRRQGGA